jgi:hypothetical protein
MVVLGAASPALGSYRELSQELLDGPSVINYGAEPILFQESERFIVQGEKRAGGGCRFVYENELDLGAPEIVTLEVAFDPGSCRTLVQRGTLAPDSPQPVQALQDGVARDTEEARASASDRDGFSPASTQHPRRRAFSWTWYDEPARWVRNCDVEDPCPPLPPVNTVYNATTWTPGGDCTLAPGTTAIMEYDINWLIITGWIMIHNQWTNSGSVIECNEADLSRTRSTFRNDLFCNAVLPIPAIPHVPTHTFYDPNEVRGTKNGSATYRHVADKAGGCSFLLRVGMKDGVVAP